MQRINTERCFILHTRAYRETSLLLELFTENYGRIGAIAKGVRKAKATGRGLLQPFVPLFIGCSGRGELLTLTDYESAGAPLLLIGRRVVCAFYVNELLVRLLHRFDPHPELFQSYQTVLTNLEKTEQEQVVLRLFEKSLLQTLGYELQLQKEVETGGALDPEAFYRFDPEKGPILVASNNLGIKNQIYPGNCFLALAEEKLNTAAILRDVKRLMRQALAHYLGDKPLESGKLL